eukprot:2340382-Rhodomonas_salina.2
MLTARGYLACRSASTPAYVAQASSAIAPAPTSSVSHVPSAQYARRARPWSPAATWTPRARSSG